MTAISQVPGNIYISLHALAAIASHAALESYGVVGLAAKSFAVGISQVLVKDPLKGVEVTIDGTMMTIDMFIIIEFGTRIKSVASNVAENVKYQVENTTNLLVDCVNVHVRGLRISNPD